MKTTELHFTLTEENLIEYYRYLAEGLSSSKMYLIWIKFSIPLLCLCTVLIFKLWREPLWIFVILIIILGWWIFLSNHVWKRYLHNRVNASFLTKLNLTQFQEVTIRFGSEITLPNRVLSYSEITKIIPLTTCLVFFYGKDLSFILPLSAFKSEADIKDLLRYTLMRKEEKENANCK